MCRNRFFCQFLTKKILEHLIKRYIGSDHEQCFNNTKGVINNLTNKIKVEKYISEGSFGKVFIGCFPLSDKTDPNDAKCSSDSIRIAVKTYEIAPHSVKNVKNKYFNMSEFAWKEVVVMNNMVNPLIRNGYTPNLPYLYNWYFCDNCTPFYNRKDTKGNNAGCMILFTELAKFDMYGAWSIKLTEAQKLDDFKYDSAALFLLCSLFQIMNGLNAMQQYPQIIHKDIKAQNMLVHFIKEKPNTYVHYKVNGTDYWLPNIGTFAMISDFGLCYSVSPYIPNKFSDKTTPEKSTEKIMYNKDLGIRPGVIMGSKGKEKFTLFDVKDPNFGPYGTNNGVLLKNWNGASDNFALAKSAYPDQYKNYGMGVLDLHNKELMIP